MTLGLQVWTRSLRCIQVGNWRESVGEGRGCPEQPPALETWNSESGLNVTDCVADRACVSRGGRLPLLIEGCSKFAATIGVYIM